MLLERPFKACMLGAGYEVLCEGVIATCRVLLVVSFVLPDKSADKAVRTWLHLQSWLMY